jgi:hypothetical protein
MFSSPVVVFFRSFTCLRGDELGFSYFTEQSELCVSDNRSRVSIVGEPLKEYYAILHSVMCLSRPTQLIGARAYDDATNECSSSRALGS